MPTWQDFTAGAPELAGFALERLTGRLAYLATVRADGGPRVHPVSPVVANGRLFIYMERTSPKLHDLLRDARYALHTGVEDNDGGGGELSLSGSAHLVADADERAMVFAAARSAGNSPRERYVVFEFDVERVLATTYPGGGDPLRRRWPERGEKT